MISAQLSRKLKASNLPETLTIRIHRAISWVKSAEKQDGNLDMKFLSLWIALNACYCVDLNGMSSKWRRRTYQHSYSPFKALRRTKPNRVSCGFTQHKFLLAQINN